VPRRLGQGTLTIGCAGPVAMELQHLSNEVLGRINQYLGTQAVLRLRFVQITAARAPINRGRTLPKQSRRPPPNRFPTSLRDHSGLHWPDWAVPF